MAGVTPVGPSVRCSLTMRPVSPRLTSRTVVAWIGTPTTLVRIAVVMSAVHVKPGRTPGTSSLRVTTTLKFVARESPCSLLWIGLLPISVTMPW